MLNLDEIAPQKIEFSLKGKTYIANDPTVGQIALLNQIQVTNNLNDIKSFLEGILGAKEAKEIYENLRFKQLIELIKYITSEISKTEKKGDE